MFFEAEHFGGKSNSKPKEYKLKVEKVKKSKTQHFFSCCWGVEKLCRSFIEGIWPGGFKPTSFFFLSSFFSFFFLSSFRFTFLTFQTRISFGDELNADFEEERKICFSHFCHLKQDWIILAIVQRLKRCFTQKCWYKKN